MFSNSLRLLQWVDQFSLFCLLMQRQSMFRISVSSIMFWVWLLEYTILLVSIIIDFGKLRALKLDPMVFVWGNIGEFLFTHDTWFVLEVIYVPLPIFQILFIVDDFLLLLVQYIYQHLLLSFLIGLVVRRIALQADIHLTRILLQSTLLQLERLIVIHKCSGHLDGLHMIWI